MNFNSTHFVELIVYYLLLQKEMSQHGFIALPRDINVLLKGKENINDPEPVMVRDITLPQTPLAKKVQEFAKMELREETYNQYVYIHTTLLLLLLDTDNNTAQ